MKDALPDWMLRDENYQPAPDKDAFIHKSILSVLGVLSRIKTQDGRESKPAAHAVFKLTFTLLFVILLSLSHSFAFVLVMAVGMLLRLCLLPAKDIARALKSSLAGALFSLVILLPAAFLGNLYSIAMIPLKVFTSVAAVSLLSSGTRWNELNAALKIFFLPDLFIFVLDITIKYILMLGDFALNMLYALKLRSVGKNRAKGDSLSGIAGLLFLRSREMAEEMHSAMVCRGFTGEYARPGKIILNLWDGGVLLMAAACAGLFFYLR